MRSRRPRLTIPGHNHSVSFWGDPKPGPKATTYQAQRPRKIAVVTAVDGDAIEALRHEVREGLLTFLQRSYPEALPGGQARRPSA
jgi:hypothetical protein